MRKSVWGMVGLVVMSGAVQQASAADARAEVVAAMQQMAKPGNKIHTSAVNTSDAKSMKSSVDIIMPDHFHVMSERAEIVVVPEGSWMKQGGEWHKLPMDMSRMIGQFAPSAMAEAEKNMSDVKYVGEESIGGERAKIYTYTTSLSMMGVKSVSNAKIWVGAGNKVIHMESDGTAMGKTSHTVQDITYDNSIRITPPN